MLFLLCEYVLFLKAKLRVQALLFPMNLNFQKRQLWMCNVLSSGHTLIALVHIGKFLQNSSKIAITVVFLSYILHYCKPADTLLTNHILFLSFCSLPLLIFWRTVNSNHSIVWVPCNLETSSTKLSFHCSLPRIIRVQENAAIFFTRI